MKSGRYTWLACLALVVLVGLGGQAWALDASAAGESDPTISAPDDSFVALFGSLAAAPARSPVSPQQVEYQPPSDRFVISDLFRPPEHASR